MQKLPKRDPHYKRKTAGALFDSLHFSNHGPEPVLNRLRRNTLSLVEEVLSHLNIVLYFSTYSATAPITALAKRMGFRGATMHGCNETILNSGLARDYEDVSARAERFRQALTRCDNVVIEFETLGRKYQLTLELGVQEAQKSHGLCRVPGEIANLPAGEIYWVPTGAQGQFPLKFKEDGTLALMEVSELRIRNGTLLRGNAATVQRALALFKEDPATGELGELGLGTQVLPFAGADIQDEKILGTLHVATGRDDHLGGKLDPSKFKDKRHATHEDILFAPRKTPEICLRNVWMHKGGREVLLIKDYEPTDFCAVGRFTFELGRVLNRVTGIDSSRSFIRAARQMAKVHSLHAAIQETGSQVSSIRLLLPRALWRSRVQFRVGDATDLKAFPDHAFQVVAAINLIDRLPQSRAFLSQLPRLLSPGGQLLIASPFTWLREYTPPREWLSSQRLQELFRDSFRLARHGDLPFFIREHRRKFQLVVAEVFTFVSPPASPLSAAE